jgi:integrase
MSALFVREFKYCAQDILRVHTEVNQMGGKRQKEKRKFTIHDREFWFTKEQVQKEFGCTVAEAEQMWQEAPVNKATDWLNHQKKSTAKVYKSAWRNFEEFTSMTSDQIVEDRKNDKEFKWERKILEFKQWLLDKGKAPYTATNWAMAVSGFFNYHRMKLEPTIQEAKRLSERTRKTEDYLFIVDDLKRMFDVADLDEKYVLVAGKSFGLRADDFLRLTRGHFEPYIERPVPISIGWIETGNEKVPAYPFIDTDAKPVIKNMLDKMTREGHTNSEDRILMFKERQLSATLKRLAKKAGLKFGNKQVRFHCLRKFLIDNISRVMSESKWKQIVGKKISERAYVSLEGLRDEYKRAMSKTTFTKTLSENEIELRAAQRALEIQLSMAAGIPQHIKERMLKKIRSVKKLRVFENVQNEIIERIKQLEAQRQNNNCPDGENCQRIVSEAELGGLLTQGWRVAAVLPSGKIVVSNEL